MKKQIIIWILKHKFLLRLLLSAIFLFIIPILIIIMVLIINTYGKIQSIQYEEASLSTARVADKFDGIVHEMTVSALRIMTNRRLNYKVLEQQTYNEVEGIETLGNFKQIITFVDEVGIYYSSVPILYTSAGKFIPQVYAKWVLNMDAENFVEQLRDLNMYGFLDGLSAADMAVFYYPGTMLPISDGQVGAFFLIHKKTFLYYLELELPEDFKIFAIYDTTGKQIFGDANDLPGELSEFEVKDFVERLNSSEPVRYNNNIFFYSESLDGFYFITTTQIELFSQKTEVFRNSVILIGIIMIIICTFLIFIMAWINYLPIDKLLARLKKKQKLEKVLLENTEITSELDTILGVIERYSNEKETSNRELVIQHNELVAQIFEKLLGGTALTDHEISALSFEGEFYFAAAAYHTGFTRLNAWRDLLLSKMNNQEQICILEDPFKGYIIFIFALNSGEANVRLAHIRELRKILHANEAQFGIGSTSTKIEDLCQSYLEAVCALQWCSESESIVCYDKQSKEFSTFSYEKATHLSEFIINESLMMAKLDELFESMDIKMNSLLIQRDFCFKLLTQIDQMIERLNSKSQWPAETAKNTLKSNWYTTIMNCADIKEMHDSMRLMFVEYYIREHHRKQEYYDKKSVEIVDYVNANFSNAELCLELLCSHFDVLDYTISRMFKEKTGSSFRRYLIYRRVEYAKELIITTGMSINEIAVKTGFGSVSHFTRTFKSIEGITTSEYRKHSSL